MNASNLVITNQYFETDIVYEKESRSGIYINEIEDDCLMDNDNLSFEVDYSPKTLKSKIYFTKIKFRSILLCILMNEITTQFSSDCT